MEGKTVDQDDVVVEESYFETEFSSKSTWKFFNQATLLRSEVVFFVQMFNFLNFLKPKCEEISVWI